MTLFLCCLFVCFFVLASSVVLPLSQWPVVNLKEIALLRQGLSAG